MKFDIYNNLLRTVHVKERYTQTGPGYTDGNWDVLSKIKFTDFDANIFNHIIEQLGNQLTNQLEFIPGKSFEVKRSQTTFSIHGKNQMKNKHINEKSDSFNHSDFNNANKQMLLKKLTQQIESIPQLVVKLKENHIKQIEEINEAALKQADIEQMYINLKSKNNELVKHIKQFTKEQQWKILGKSAEQSKELSENLRLKDLDFIKNDFINYSNQIEKQLEKSSRKINFLEGELDSLKLKLKNSNCDKLLKKLESTEQRVDQYELIIDNQKRVLNDYEMLLQKFNQNFVRKNIIACKFDEQERQRKQRNDQENTKQLTPLKSFRKMHLKTSPESNKIKKYKLHCDEQITQHKHNNDKNSKQQKSNSFRNIQNRNNEYDTKLNKSTDGNNATKIINTEIKRSKTPQNIRQSKRSLNK